MRKIKEIAAAMLKTASALLMLCGAFLLLIAAIPVAFVNEIIQEIKFRKRSN